MLSPEALAASVTAAAISISKDKSGEELNLMSAVFTQLGDILNTIAAQRNVIEACRGTVEESVKNEDKPNDG